MSNIFDPVIINYMIDGFLGGVLYVFVSKLGYNDKWDIFRRVGMGVIAGIIVFYAGLPNHLSALGMGYVGIDAMEAILKKRAEQIQGVPIVKSGDKERSKEVNKEYTDKQLSDYEEKEDSEWKFR